MRDGVVVAVCRSNGCTYWGEGEKKREIWCGGPIPPLQTIQSNKEDGLGCLQWLCLEIMVQCWPRS